MDCVFGPVLSKRLGLSLGVEIVPTKVCSYNCVYCEVGKESELSTGRESYVPVDKVIEEVESVLRSNNADWITITGAGEPTLNKDIGTIIDKIKERFKQPVCVLTNGSTLSDEKVREALKGADLVMPSLDTVDEAEFKRMLMPQADLKLSEIIEGVRRFTHEFSGKLWIEVIVVEGYNDKEEDMRAIAEELKSMRVDKLYLGTVYRPPLYDNVKPVSKDRLAELAKVFKDAGFEVTL